MNSTFLLTASSEALNPCCLLFFVSAVTWQERAAPVPKHSECCPQLWLPLDGAWAALVGCQMGLYPSCSKIIPAERCAKPLEGVEAPGSIPALLLFRIFPLCMSSFEWNDFWYIGWAYGSMVYTSTPGSCQCSQ